MKMDGGIVLTSSEPLKNRMLVWRKLYWLTLVFLIIGLFIKTSFIGIAIIYLMICYTINDALLRRKWGKLRKCMFKFKQGITYDEVFSKLQPALLSIYGSSFMIERDSAGGITISYDGLYYDLILEEDHFRIHWRTSLGRAFLLLLLHEYKYYRKILVAMGMIGYELQKAFDIK
jgi:hypothetical protein